MNLHLVLLILSILFVTCLSSGDCPDSPEDDALIEATKAGDLDLATCLIQGNKISLDQQDSVKRTALMWAQISDHTTGWFVFCDFLL